MHPIHGTPHTFRARGRKPIGPFAGRSCTAACGFVVGWLLVVGFLLIAGYGAVALPKSFGSGQPARAMLRDWLPGRARRLWSDAHIHNAALPAAAVPAALTEATPVVLPRTGWTATASDEEVALATQPGQ